MITKYFLYVRKSQDRSDRQIASIDDQINEMKSMASRNGYHIERVFVEQQSAKKPGRPVFNDIIERIQKGEAQGILCWKLNRLARNPIDAGTISWLLQSNVIQIIQSRERTYLPTDNVLMMQVDFGVANQFVKDLSVDVKRGMRSKAQNGWCPTGILPIGYLHHSEKQKAKKQIICDRKQYPIIKELWRLLLTGAYSIIDLKTMGDNMGLVNPKGNPFAINTFSLLFRNPFYYGMFYWKNKEGERVLFQGKHTPMISETEFILAQEILEKRAYRYETVKEKFIYRGLITCGECSSHVSAERKQQAICTFCKTKFSIRTKEECPRCDVSYKEMDNPSMIDITYYRCTRNLNKKCSQRSMTDTQIEESILSFLSKISIPEELFELYMSKALNIGDSSMELNKTIVESLKTKIKRLEVKIERLIELQISGEVDSIQAKNLNTKYSKELAKTKQDIVKKENEHIIQRNENVNYLNFALNCVNRFKNGTPEEKKAITKFFASNLKILDKKLVFSTKNAPQVLSEMHLSNILEMGASNLKSC